MNNNFKNIAAVNDLVYWNQRYNAETLKKDRYGITETEFFGIITKVRENMLEVWAPYYNGKIKIRGAEVIRFEKSIDGTLENTRFLVPSSPEARDFIVTDMKKLIEQMVFDLDNFETAEEKNNCIENLAYTRQLLKYFENYQFAQ